MFLDSVLKGLLVLTYWQVYIVGIIYTVIIFLPLILIGLIMSKFESLGFITIFIDPFFRALATFIFIFTLSPIILGLSDKVAWSLPWLILINEPWYILKICILLIFLSFFLGLIPILGQIQSLQTLLLGSTCLISLLKLIHSIDPNFKKRLLPLL